MQIMPLTIMPFMIFGGLLVNLNTIPDWLSWFQYISPIRYSYNGMLMEDFSQIGALSCSFEQQKPDGSCPYDNGAAWVATMGMDISTGDCLWILLGMYGVMRLWAYGMLVLITTRSKM